MNNLCDCSELAEVCCAVRLIIEAAMLGATHVAVLVNVCWEELYAVSWDKSIPAACKLAGLDLQSRSHACRTSEV